MEHIQTINRCHPARAWIESLRLRTLPLAFASILNGAALAWQQQAFSPVAILLILVTAALLQILANLANDYGDAQKGADDATRIGPLRGIQKGVITLKQLRSAIIITVALTLLSGIMLIVQTCHTTSDVLVFLLLGALAIIAAIAYTVGKTPYGYRGLGDLSVLLFFGWLGVAGSCYLLSHQFRMITLLPATACGLLATAVLNINNLRDCETDRQNGKFTLAVRLGPQLARRYHAVLLAGAVICLILFALLQTPAWYHWLFLLSVPLLCRQGRYVLQETTPQAMRPMLEKTVKCALLTNILFIIGLLPV